MVVLPGVAVRRAASTPCKNYRQLIVISGWHYVDSDQATRANACRAAAKRKRIVEVKKTTRQSARMISQWHMLRPAVLFRQDVAIDQSRSRAASDMSKLSVGDK
jgi:hypothetical protein